MLDKVSGQAIYAIMSFGGFLGMGEKHHPLPWSSLKYDTGKEGYVVDLDKKQLEGAPSYDDRDFDGRRTTAARSINTTARRPTGPEIRHCGRPASITGPAMAIAQEATAELLPPYTNLTVPSRDGSRRGRCRRRVRVAIERSSYAESSEEARAFPPSRF